MEFIKLDSNEDVTEESLTELDGCWNDEWPDADDESDLDDDFWTTEPVEMTDEDREQFDIDAEKVLDSMDNTFTEAKSDDGYEDYEELDIRTAVDTLADCGGMEHTSMNGSIAEPYEDELTGEIKRDKAKAMAKDEDEEEPGYFVFYGSSAMSKAKKVAERIKSKFGVDIIITPGDGMVEMEVPAYCELPLKPLNKKAKKGKKVDLLADNEESNDDVANWLDSVQW